MEFDGKVVIVTGSTSGIGEQIALDFAKNGAKIVIHGRNENRLKSVVDKCTEVSPSNQKPLGILADIRDDEQLQRIIESTISYYGRIDVLVNNAGICHFVSVSDPKLVSIFDETIQNNLRPLVILSSLAIPHLIASKGCIVNMSSIGAIKPEREIMPFCAADAAKDMVTRSMALELGPKGVRVNSVQPGYIKTPIYVGLGRVFEDTDDLKKQPLPKQGLPEDVSNAVLYLASDKSAFITGASMKIDGGVNDA